MAKLQRLHQTMKTLVPLRGGFLPATLARARRELVDAKFVVKSVEHHLRLFGKAPRAYAYDRPGHSQSNVATLTNLGVKAVGLALRGRTHLAVSSERIRKELVRERAMVESGIGAVKSRRYNFYRPRARSVRVMGASGQLAVLGFNLNKLVRGVAARRNVAVVG